MRYVLDAEAGSSSKIFPNAPYPRDCDEHGALLASRRRSDGRGMGLEDFWQCQQSQLAKLELAHVAALRIYSTAAHKTLNNALRDPSRREASREHPMPVTVAFISAAVSSLRAVDALGPTANDKLDLYRGLRNVDVEDSFMQLGGSAAQHGAPSFLPTSTQSAVLLPSRGPSPLS